MNKSKKSLVVVGAMVMAYALAFPQSVSAGQKLPTNGKAQPPRKAAAQEAGEKAAGDGGREGIKVHGHWAIEIRNQDGTVAAHREFENSLVGQGQFFLAALLSRHYTTGIWQVSVNSSAGNGPCSPAECLIMEALPPGVTSQKNWFVNLTMSQPGASGLVTLSGTANADTSASLGSVSTSNIVCGAYAPVYPGCATLGGVSFTSANISPPIPVSAGQTIAVTVTFTFS